MITKKRLLKDLASIRHNIDCDETKHLISFQAWSLVDCAIAELESNIDTVMVEINEENWGVYEELTRRTTRVKG